MLFLQVFVLLCVRLPYSQQFGYARPEEYTVCHMQGLKCYAAPLCGPEDSLPERYYCQSGERCCRSKPCISDSDCILRPNSHCNERRCRCDIGYGLDGDTCRDLRECVNFSNITTVYRGYYSWGYNTDRVIDQSSESCQQLCINTPDCISAEIYLPTSLPPYPSRFLSEHNWLDVDIGDQRQGDIYDYFQRECSW